jgi:hypothetical protein
MKYITQVKITLLTDQKDDYDADNNSNDILKKIIDKLPESKFEKIITVGSSNDEATKEDLKEIKAKI